MKFEHALDALRDNYKVRRTLWSDRRIWVVLIPMHATHVPQKFAGGYPVEHYLMLHTSSDTLVPFTLTSADVLSDDWELVNDARPATSMTSLQPKET